MFIKGKERRKKEEKEKGLNEWKERKKERIFFVIKDWCPEKERKKDRQK